MFPSVALYHQPICGYALIGHPAQHGHAFGGKACAVNPARGLAQALAGFARFALHQRYVAVPGGRWAAGRPGPARRGPPQGRSHPISALGHKDRSKAALGP